MGATEPVRARFVVGRWRWHWAGCVGRYEGLEKPSPFSIIILSGIASSFSLHSLFILLHAHTFIVPP